MQDNGCRIVLSSKEKVELEPFMLSPESLAADEVFGRTVVSLISPGTEIALYKGYMRATYPIRLGYASVFAIEAIGTEVADLQVGDLVFGILPHQSVVKAKRRDVLPLAKGMVPETVIFSRLAGVSMSTLTTTVARPPQKVLVNGLGIIGNLASQIFQSCGYDVIACDPDPRRRAYATQKGIDSVFDHCPVDDPAIAGHVSLVLACRGHEKDVLDGCKVVCNKGEVALIGVPWEQKTDLSAFEIIDAVFHRYVVLRSGWEWEIPIHSEKSGQCCMLDNMTAAMDWLDKGRISVEGLYSLTSVCNVQEVFRRIHRRECEELTFVLDWRNIDA